ncbi:MAG: hypothetical protein ACOX8B_05895 [Lachnospiraceae bacterium]|jgi:hypothetical protein
MKTKMNFSTVMALAACAVSCAAAVLFVIYGIQFHVYFDTFVLACDLVAAVSFFLYAREGGRWASWLNLLGTVLMSVGLGLFFLNSYPVWADWYGNFDMYGSQGGITRVIVQMAVVLAAILAGIVSCFGTRRVSVRG